MKSGKLIYFAYGANLNLDGMDYRCPGHRPLCRAVLKDHRLVFRGVADIEPVAGHQVHGALYELTPDHLRALDRFEGYPRLYTRKALPVITDNGKQVNAVVYLMNGRRGYAPPARSYLMTILTGCRRWGLPVAYVRSVLAGVVNPHLGEP